MTTYRYAPIEEVWKPDMIQSLPVMDAITLIRTVYRIPANRPFASVAIPTLYDPRREMIARAFAQSNPSSLAYFIIPNDSRFTVLFVYRILKSILPNKPFMIAEGSRGGLLSYFCVDPSSNWIYDLTYYLPKIFAHYKSDGSFSRLMADQSVELKETFDYVRYFEEPVFVQEMAWKWIGIDICRPPGQRIVRVYPPQEAVDLIQLKNLDDQYATIKGYWIRSRKIHYWNTNPYAAQKPRPASSHPTTYQSRQMPPQPTPYQSAAPQPTPYQSAAPQPTPYQSAAPPSMQPIPTQQSPAQQSPPQSPPTQPIEEKEESLPISRVEIKDVSDAEALQDILGRDIAST